MPGDLASDERVARRAMVLATLAVLVALAIGLAAFRFGPAPDVDAARRDVGAATVPETHATDPVPATASPGRVPPSDPVDPVARGRSLYLASCAACHGATGQGRVGPPLDATAEPGRISEAHVAELVTRGSLRMPAVGSAWSDPDVAAVGAFLRSLRTP